MKLQIQKAAWEHHGSGVSHHHQRANSSGAARLLRQAGEGSCPRREAGQSAQPCSPGAHRRLCSLAWSTAGGNSPARSTLLAAAFAQPRYLAEEGSLMSQADSLPKSRGGNSLRPGHSNPDTCCPSFSVWQRQMQRRRAFPPWWGERAVRGNKQTFNDDNHAPRPRTDTCCGHDRAGGHSRLRP